MNSTLRQTYIRESWEWRKRAHATFVPRQGQNPLLCDHNSAYTPLKDPEVLARPWIVPKQILRLAFFDQTMELIARAWKPGL